MDGEGSANRTIKPNSSYVELPRSTLTIHPLPVNTSKERWKGYPSNKLLRVSTEVLIKPEP
jgi:hypothetical protein